MTPADLDGVATFYNMIFRKPVGQHVILLCDSVSCWIMGYDRLREHLATRLGIGPGETTADGRFTLLPNRLPRRLRPCSGHDDRRRALPGPRSRPGSTKFLPVINRKKMNRLMETPLTRNISPGEGAA